MLRLANALGLQQSQELTREQLDELLSAELHRRRRDLEGSPMFARLYESIDRDARRAE